MSNVVVRVMAPPDLAGVAELSGQLGYPVAPPDLERRFVDLASRTDDALFVVDVDGGVVGWVHVGLHRSLEAPPMAVLWGLVVATGARRLGVGTALVSCAGGWAREHACATLRVRTNVQRIESHPFYERLGFARIKTQHAYELRL